MTGLLALQRERCRSVGCVDLGHPPYICFHLLLIPLEFGFRDQVDTLTRWEIKRVIEVDPPGLAFPASISWRSANHEFSISGVVVAGSSHH